MFKQRALLYRACTSALAMSMLNIDMLCRQLGYAYYDCYSHGIVLLFINPKYTGVDKHLVGLSFEAEHLSTEILIAQNNYYSFFKDRFDYTSKFLSQQDYINYIKRCHEYTMKCYKLDGIL